MATVPDTKLLKTSAGTWTDFISHAGAGFTTVTSIVVKNTIFGAARVAIRFAQSGGLTNELAGPEELSDGASYRFRLPAIRLKNGDKIQVNSLGGVDWTAGLEVTT